MSEISQVFSGATNQDNDYTVLYIIDANGIEWKIRVDTNGVLSTEQA